jgi:GST-like protein
MIDLYISTTPNGQKILMLLEEAEIPYRIQRLRLSRGEHLTPEFAAINPNQRIPAIVDDAPLDGGEPIKVFESGAILLYLAEKHGVFLPAEPRRKLDALQWLFWQVSYLGPFSGQAGHFNVHAKEKVPYAIARYLREVRRLFGVLDRRLAGREFIIDDYSVVDMACYPWVVPWRGLGQDLDEFPNLKRWFDAIAARPATQRVYEGIEDTYVVNKVMTDAERAVLFGAPAKPAG